MRFLAAFILILTPLTAFTQLTEPVEHRAELLDMMSGVATYLATLQDDSGAIIDPFIHKEHQYSAPYFAAGVACLVDAGRADDALTEAGALAMDRATADFARGHEHIPDGHGEFYIASLTEALLWFQGHVNADRWASWRERMTTPIDTVIEGRSKKINNWRTYAMKGEWLRAEAGLVDREQAIAFIEDAWTFRTQRERILSDEHNLYQDWNGDPQSHAVEAVGRGNLMGLIAHGYDGPSANEMREAIMHGTRTSLYMQSPEGQCPPNGRTDNHVFNDVLYALIFDVMAEREWAAGNRDAAGQFRRAAQLGYGSARRWQRNDGEWTGSFYVTKNRFDPAERVGYQPASQYTNYNATILFHLAEAYHAWQTDIPPLPTPAESESYVKVMDDAFGSAVINHKGAQVFVNLRGDSVPKYGEYWTPLGIVRVSMPGMDPRLGPLDGTRNRSEGTAAIWGPTWKENDKWVTLPDKAEHYRGHISVTPNNSDNEWVAARILYAPVTGVGGPSFRVRISINDEYVHIHTDSPNAKEFGIVVPVLVNDGRYNFRTLIDKGLITFDQEDNAVRLVGFLGGVKFDTLETVRGASGDLQLLRVTKDPPDARRNVLTAWLPLQLPELTLDETGRVVNRDRD